jgi:hypothetical protein
MLFYHKNKFLNQPKLFINDHELEFVESFKFLGIHIDKDLNWTTHINAIHSKILSVIGVLNRLKFFLPSDVKLKIYSALIGCRINYAILLWGHAGDKIFKLQKKAVRLILNRKYNAHSEPLFKILS